MLHEYASSSRRGRRSRGRTYGIVALVAEKYNHVPVVVAVAQVATNIIYILPSSNNKKSSPVFLPQSTLNKSANSPLLDLEFTRSTTTVNHQAGTPPFRGT
jgi:hypothetical protein